MAEPPQEENDDNPGSCIEIEEDPEHERVKCKLRSPKTPQRPNIKIQPHLSSRYPPGTLPANQRIWAATVARKEDKETSKIALGRPEYLSIVQKYAPGTSQAQVNKLFWIIYEHGASDKASSKEDIMCYTAGDKSTHEICVIDSTM